MRKFELLNEVESHRIAELVNLRYWNGKTSTKKKQGESEKLISAVEELYLDPNQFDETSFKEFSFSALLEYLRNGHKLYRNKMLPEIQLSIVQLAKSIGEEHPLTMVLAHFIEDYRKELDAHMSKEDDYVFPYIEQLYKSCEKNSVFRPATFLNGWSTLAAFLESHTDTEKDLQVLSTMLKNFAKNSDYKNQINRLLTQLNFLELDLHIHARIEDDVLIPKALLLEKKIHS